MTAPWPISPRRSASTPATPRRISIAATSGSARAPTSPPSTTTTGRSASTRGAGARIAGGDRRPGSGRIIPRPISSTEGNVREQARGDYARALDDYGLALKLDPEYAPALNNRAWLRATCPDPGFRRATEAIGEATAACEMTDWKHANYVDTLAVGPHAEQGSDFAKAAAYTEQRALDLCKGDEPWKARWRARLDLYKAGKPFRTKPGDDESKRFP